MKTSRPHLVLLSLLAIVAALTAACRSSPKRTILKLKIAPDLTHVSVGQSARLAAYQQYREESNDPEAVSAAGEGLHHEAIAPHWSVSDTRVATVSEDGTLTALEPGRVTIKSRWEAYEDTTTVEVVRNLPLGSLPQMSSRGLRCAPQSIALGLEADRSINFRLGFDEDDCRDVKLHVQAPGGSLPWKLEAGGVQLELTAARGSIVNGRARLLGGEVTFTVWAEGAGAFPVSLKGQTVLLVGDSMAEGIAPHLQKTVEGAGGRFVNGQERSSTIVWWQGSGKLRELLNHHRPDVVFISLGSNELFVEQPSLRAPLIKAMVADIGARPAFWIGPPCWKPDKGLTRVIEENFQSGHFYNSNNLEVARARDGKHPTAQGFQTWAELIWNWYARAV